MDKFTKVVKEFWQDEEGLTAVEYAIAGSLIALAVVTAFTNLGTAVGDAITDMTNVINGTT
ncbi:Flp family type IVb pilin [Vibrio furnissii]|uniref:Flp family type IVb pilin n=1 Tax=Vibrio furnissii TaxID=29494 RepID=UPI00399B3F3A